LPLPLPHIFFVSPRPPPSSPLFPYTTLFRSCFTANLVRRTLPRGLQTETCVAVSPTGDAGVAALLTRPVRVMVNETKRRRRPPRSEEHTSELQSRSDLVCRLLLEKKKRVTCI